MTLGWDGGGVAYRGKRVLTVGTAVVVCAMRYMLDEPLVIFGSFGVVVIVVAA